MKAIASAGLGIMLAASMVLAGCGGAASAAQVPLSPAVANDLIGATTLSSASLGPLSASTLAPAAWDDASEAPAAEAIPTWGATDLATPAASPR